jgi:hypothetical protein
MAQGRNTTCPKRSKKVRLHDFTCIEDPHPYGVLPGGNRFFGSPCSSSARKRSEEVFDEKLWQHIISFCDGSSHARLVQASRYLYVVGHQPELWRDQVLRKCDAEKLVISKVGSSWKDTYALMFHGNGSNNNSSDGTDAIPTFRPHKPMRIPNIYSDTIYRSHLCRSFAIPPQWLEQASVETTTMEEGDKTTKKSCSSSYIKEVDTVLIDDLTPTTFFADYEGRNQPVVVRGAANGKAVDRWKDWDYLTNKNSTNKKSYRSTSGAAPLPGNFSLEAYRDYTRSTTYLEESPLYLFDRTAFATNTEWKDDFFPEFYQKCPYWDPSAEHGHDLLQHLGAKERPDHTWIIMGPKRSGSEFCLAIQFNMTILEIIVFSPDAIVYCIRSNTLIFYVFFSGVFHIDPNATHAWNACIRGRKRWIFYPPGKPRESRSFQPEQQKGIL